MVYTVTFNPAVDYIVHTKQLIAGATNRSDSEEIYFGGKGINVSIVLSELGVKSKALGFVAGCEKGAYEYALKLGTASGGATAFSEGLAEKDRIYELLGQLG